MNLALVEDHAALRESLVEVLASEGHHVTAFESAEVFFANCSVGSVDIAVLDLNLPGEDGISLARRLRAARPDIGIIMLTARASPEDRKIGYLEGADIYLAKPSSAEELTSSVTALSRRLNPDTRNGGSLKLDLRTMVLEGPMGSILLSASDASLVVAFLAAPDKRLTTEAIAQVGGPASATSKGAVGVKMVRLRKKLRLAGADQNPILVLRGWGFQLCAQITLYNE